jgi:hypothetical protein
MAMLIRNQPRGICGKLKGSAVTADAQPVRSLERYLDESRICRESEQVGVAVSANGIVTPARVSCN